MSPASIGSESNKSSLKRRTGVVAGTSVKRNWPGGSVQEEEKTDTHVAEYKRDVSTFHENKVGQVPDWKPKGSCEDRSLLEANNQAQSN